MHLIAFENIFTPSDIFKPPGNSIMKVIINSKQLLDTLTDLELEAHLF